MTDIRLEQRALALTESGLLSRQLFPAKTPEDDLVRDMLESISVVKHKA